MSDLNILSYHLSSYIASHCDVMVRCDWRGLIVVGSFLDKAQDTVSFPHSDLTCVHCAQAEAGVERDAYRFVQEQVS